MARRLPAKTATDWRQPGAARDPASEQRCGPDTLSSASATLCYPACRLATCGYPGSDNYPGLESEQAASYTKGSARLGPALSGQAPAIPIQKSPPARGTSTSSASSYKAPTSKAQAKVPPRPATLIQEEMRQMDLDTDRRMAEAMASFAGTRANLEAWSSLLSLSLSAH